MKPASNSQFLIVFLSALSISTKTKMFFPKNGNQVQKRSKILIYSSNFLILQPKIQFLSDSTENMIQFDVLENIESISIQFGINWIKLEKAPHLILFYMWKNLDVTVPAFFYLGVKT